MQFKQINSEFDIAQKYREYAISEQWKVNQALWNTIRSFAGDAGSKLYERLTNLTKNISDVDICDIKQLESISYQFGLNSGFSFIDGLPTEIYEAMCALSIKHSFILQKNKMFSDAGIESMIASLPVEEVEAVDSIFDDKSEQYDNFVNAFSLLIIPAHTLDGSYVHTIQNAKSIRIKHGDNVSLTFNNGNWIISDNITDVHSGMSVSEFKGEAIADINSYAICKEPSSTLYLSANRPDGSNLQNGDRIDLKVSFSEIPVYVKAQNIINGLIVKTYKDIIFEKLKCRLNAGNENDLSLLKDKFVSLVGNTAYQRAINDKNVNYEYYLATVYGDFCSNITSISGVSKDWFLDSEIHETLNPVFSADTIIDDVAKILADLTLSISMRRETVKTLASQYSSIGTDNAFSRIVKQYILKNYTDKSEDWNFISNNVNVNNKYLPKLDNIASDFSVSITEYWDQTEYLNISADSAKLWVQDGMEQTTKISSHINSSGLLITSLIIENVPHYVESNLPLISGGNDRFWEMDDYIAKFAEKKEEIKAFYKNVAGCPDILLKGNNLQEFLSKLWSINSVSAFSDNEFQKKYIGGDDSYYQGINIGNPDYPTIAPVVNVLGLTEAIASMDRDYQSVVNEDRPPTVIGVAPLIQSRIECVPWDPINDPISARIIGTPNDMDHTDIYSYVYVVTSYQQEIITSGYVETSNVYQTVNEVQWSNVSTYNQVQELSSWQSPIISSYFEMQDMYDTILKLGDIIYMGGNLNITNGYAISGIVTDPGSGSTAIMSNTIVTYKIPSNFYVYDDTSKINEIRSEYNGFISNDLDLAGRSISDDLTDRYNSIQNNIDMISAASYLGYGMQDKTYVYIANNPIVAPQQYTYNPLTVAKVKNILDEEGNVIGSVSSTYGDLINSINNNKNSVSPYVSSDIVSYSNAVINGNISSNTGAETIVTFESLLRSMSDNIDKYLEMEDLRTEFNTLFNDIKLSATVDCFNAFDTTVETISVDIASINSGIETAYQNRQLPREEFFVKPLSSLSASQLDEMFDPASGITYNAPNNTVTLDRTYDVIGQQSITKTVTAYVDITGYVAHNELTITPVSTMTEAIKIDTVTAYVEENLEVMIPTIYNVTAYKENIIPGSLPDANINYSMFDSYGGLINSWRNINVELRGYHSRYEASPNLDNNYDENKFIDTDGPFIGEALYSLIASLCEATASSEPDATKLDVEALRDANISVQNSNNYNPDGWWLADYISQVHISLEGQLKFYINDILSLRNKSIVEFETDSFKNQYTLYKDKSITDKYDVPGVLWMRYNNFPFSFPILEKPPVGWDDGRISSSELTETIAETRTAGNTAIDQIDIGYAVYNHRSIMNNCLSFGINNSSLWVAGYDGRNSDGTDHFNIRIYANEFFEKNFERCFGTVNSRSMFQFNSDALGIPLSGPTDRTDTDNYSWKNFIGGYYDGGHINFIFFTNAGFAVRTFDIATTRLTSANKIIKFSEESFLENNSPKYDGNKNPFRLVEDDSYFYTAYTTLENKLVVCRIDKVRLVFKNYIKWTIPENDAFIDKLVCGNECVKIKLKSGNIYYGVLTTGSFTSNASHQTMILADDVTPKYIVVDGATDVVLPKVPILDIAQWRQFCYSLTNNTLLTMQYDDVMAISSISEYNVLPGGQHYDFIQKTLYVPGNYLSQEVASYVPETGVLENLDGTETLTGYSLGTLFADLTTGLQSMIHAYGPNYATSGITPSESREAVLQLMQSSNNITLSAYHGLPYNALYVERTDLRNDNNSRKGPAPFGRYNYIALKNFYNYGYNHEYDWNQNGDDYDNHITGWRKYLKCGISKYSDAMWLSYNYIRDPKAYSNFNKQKAVAKVLNDYEWVELVYGTIQLMNTACSKSNVFSVKISDSTLSSLYGNENVQDEIDAKEALRKQAESDIRQFADKYVPAHTQLWKVEIEN